MAQERRRACVPLRNLLGLICRAKMKTQIPPSVDRRAATCIHGYSGKPGQRPAPRRQDGASRLPAPSPALGRVTHAQGRRVPVQDREIPRSSRCLRAAPSHVGSQKEHGRGGRQRGPRREQTRGLCPLPAGEGKPNQAPHPCPSLPHCLPPSQCASQRILTSQKLSFVSISI